MRKQKSLCERIYNNITFEPNTGCWLWTARVGRKGYGVLIFDGKYQRAHRLSYHLHKGCLHPSMMVCHQCDVPACVNPSHLFLGTAKDNTQDSIRKGRHKANLTHTSRENNPRSKLSERDILEIRSSKENNIVTGERYGVHNATISKIRLGHRW